ncbi:FkbM family methyltransferase [Bradyrhizobium sp. AZCC 1577]
MSHNLVSLTKAIIPASLHPTLGRLRLRLAPRSTPRFQNWRYKEWPVLQCDIAYNALGGYCVPLSSRHRYAAQVILRGNVYESHTIDFIVQNAKDGDVVHAGAFFGDFLPALSRACAPLRKVWAFEPDPENYRCALITTLINDLQNVSLMNAGLGDTRGVAKLVTHDEAGKSLGELSHIQLHHPSPRPVEAVTVEMVTIDETIPADRKVSILHLDVEGFEQQVLTGALTTIRRNRPFLILEDVPSEDWFAKNLSPLGYRVDRRIHHNTLLVPDRTS